MTEDPIKLYVVVMTILVCVLGWVAHTSYQQARAFEEAIERAPGDAEALRQLASDVTALCDQLKRSKLGKGRGTLIEAAAADNGIKLSKVGEVSSKRIGSTGKEIRFEAKIGRSGDARPQPRDRIARFCSQVERDARGFMKTIEISLTRHTGTGSPRPGTEEEVKGDTYTGKIIFGVRVVDDR